MASYDNHRNTRYENCRDNPREQEQSRSRQPRGREPPSGPRRSLYDCIYTEPHSRDHRNHSRYRSPPRDAGGPYAQRLGRFELKMLLNQKVRTDDLLSGSNWIMWKSMILTTLQNNQLGDFPNGNAKAPDRMADPAEYSAWEELDQGVFQFIYSSIKSDWLMQIPGGTIDNNVNKPHLTSAQFWNNVSCKHETFSSQALNNLIRTLKKKDADESTDIVKHIEEMEALRTKLGNVELIFDDSVFNAFLLGSLPPSWDAYTITINGMQNGSDQTSSKRGLTTIKLISNLTSEYERRINLAERDRTYQSTLPYAGSPQNRRKISDVTCRICQYDNRTTDDCRWKKNGYCTICRKGGHWTGSCDTLGKGGKANNKRKRAKDGANMATEAEDSSTIPENVSNHVALMANETFTPCYNWLADTGTTSHIACNKSQFSAYRKADKNITGVGNTCVKVIGSGAIVLTTQANGNMNKILLNDVLHVPTATDSLFSVGRFIERGNTFTANKTGGYFYNSQGGLIMTSELRNALFPLNASLSSNVANVSRGSHTWLEWHKCFGHIAISGLQHLRHGNLIDGFDVDESSELMDCETCIQAKQSRNPFPSAVDHETTFPGELTHIDLWGPARFTATNGARYYMMLIDDYSHHCTLKLLEKKSDAPQKIKDYLTSILVQSQNMPKAVQMDNGTEFMNADLKSWLEHRGFIHGPLLLIHLNKMGLQSAITGH